MLFFPSLLQLFYQPHPPPPCPTLFAFPSVFSVCLSILSVPTSIGIENMRIKDHCSKKMRWTPSESSVTISRMDALRNFYLLIYQYWDVRASKCFILSPQGTLGTGRALGQGQALATCRASTFLLQSTENGQRTHFLCFGYTVCLSPSWQVPEGRRGWSTFPEKL